MNAALLSSKKMDYQTPKDLYTWLDNQFHFDFDPCPVNPTFDGLSLDWGKRNFVNPPYGSEIKKWVEKAYREAQKDMLVVMLIPSRTDTKYWHEYIMKAHQIWFIKGRLRFGQATNPAPFPSAIVVFKGKKLLDTQPVVSGLTASLAREGGRC